MIHASVPHHATTHRPMPHAASAVVVPLEGHEVADRLKRFGIARDQP
jgi:hypothetical protein